MRATGKLGIRHTGRLQFSLLLKHTVLIAGSFIMMFPFFWMVSTAFKTPAETIAYPPTWLPRVYTLQNFFRVMELIPFVRNFLNSVAVSVAAVISQVIFCSMTGFVLAKYNFKGQKLLLLLILGKLMIPFQVTIIPVYFLVDWFGLIDTLPALVIPYLLGAYGIFLSRQFIIAIPDELLHASRVDGCSEFGIYWKLILPNIKPALAVLAIIIFMSSWSDFLWPLIVINSTKNMTLQLALATFKRQHFVEYGPLMAGTTLSVIPIVVVFFIMRRQIIENLTLSGIK